MSDEEAKLIDDLHIRARIAPNDAARCGVWEKAEATLPARMSGARAYVYEARRDVCGIAEMRAKQAADEAFREQGWRGLVEEEVRSGACEEEHKKALQEILVRVKVNVSKQADEQGSLRSLAFLDYQIAVANEQGIAWQVRPKAADEIHVLVLSQYPTEVRAAVAEEVFSTESWWNKRVEYRYLSPTESVHDRETSLAIEHPTLGRRPLVCNDALTKCGTQVSSRVVITRSDAPIDVTVKGTGCVLMTAFRSQEALPR